MGLLVHSDIAVRASGAVLNCAAPGRFVDWEGRGWWRRVFSVLTAPLVLLMHATNPSLELGAPVEKGVSGLRSCAPSRGACG